AKMSDQACTRSSRRLSRSSSSRNGVRFAGVLSSSRVRFGASTERTTYRISPPNATKLIQISQWRRSFFQMAAITNGCLAVVRLYAQGSLGVLAGRVGTDRRAEEDGAGVDDDAAVARLRRVE